MKCFFLSRSTGTTLSRQETLEMQHPTAGLKQHQSNNRVT